VPTIANSIVLHKSKVAPRLPWPIAPGFEVKVARWRHPATCKRNAFCWVYVVRIAAEEGWVSVRAFRLSTDAVTNQKSELFPLPGAEFVFECNNTRRDVEFAFAVMCDAVERRAERDEQRSERLYAAMGLE